MHFESTARSGLVPDAGKREGRGTELGPTARSQALTSADEEAAGVADARADAKQVGVSQATLSAQRDAALGAGP
jgi:hypothetical protein